MEFSNSILFGNQPKPYDILDTAKYYFTDGVLYRIESISYTPKSSRIWVDLTMSNGEVKSIKLYKDYHSIEGYHKGFPLYESLKKFRKDYKFYFDEGQVLMRKYETLMLKKQKQLESLNDNMNTFKRTYPEDFI